MEVTEKKIKANKLNGMKGGVKTPEGKNISRLNALKHGIMAKFTPEYYDLEYEQVFEMFKDQFGADTASRTVLIEQLSITYMRLRRCARFDSETIREALNPPKYEKILRDVKFERLVEVGEPATLGIDSFNSLETVLTKYEPSLLSRLIKLIEILSQ